MEQQGLARPAVSEHWVELWVEGNMQWEGLVEQLMAPESY